jgi:putative ABC transport system permease protein
MFRQFRLAARRLSRTPAVTSAVALQFALGIGGAIFVFSMVRALLFQPIPYRSPEHVVVVAPWSRWELFDALGDRGDLFDGLGAYTEDAANLSGQWGAARLRIAAVTSGFLGLSAERPVAGRLFGDADYTTAAPPVALLTYRVWKDRYGGRLTALGETLRIDGQSHTIVGVLPSSFRTVEQLKHYHDLPFDREVGAVVPRRRTVLTHAIPSSGWGGNPTIIAVLKASTSVERANHVLADVFAKEEESLRMLARRFGTDSHFRLSLVPVSRAVTGNLPVQLATLSLAVLMMAVVACGNILNVLLTRIGARRRELAVSLALGATRRHLAADLLAETLLLGTIGGSLGVLLAYQAQAVTRSLAGAFIDTGSLVIDPVVLVFAAVASMSAVLALTGLAAAWQARLASNVGLPRLAEGVTPSYRSSASVLLIPAQLGLAVMLVLLGAVLARGVIRGMQVDYGLEVDRILTTEVSVDRGDLPGSGRAYFSELLERSAYLPGVEQGALVSTVPGGPLAGNTPMRINGRLSMVEIGAISSNYFDLLSIPIVAGRSLSDTSNPSERSEVVVNEALAREFWGVPQNALGERIMGVTANPVDASQRGLEIVGVVSDSRDGVAMGTVRPKIYQDYRRHRNSQMVLMVRTNTVPPASLVQPCAASQQRSTLHDRCTTCCRCGTSFAPRLRASGRSPSS